MSLYKCNPLHEAATSNNPREMEDEMFCGCCLSSDVILLESCKHVLFYEKLFLNIQKVTLHLTYICISCHSIVKKLSEFHNMMMDTQNLLYNKVMPYNWKRKKLELTSTEHLDIEPTVVAIKTELLTNEVECIKIENAWSNTFESYFEPGVEKNEEHLTKTDNIYQNELSNIKNNTDDLVYSNQMIDDDNIDEYTIHNVIDNKTDGDSYGFDQYIDFDKPKHAVLAKGVVLPYLSRSLTGKKFTLPQIDSNEIKCVTVTLTDALAELHKKKDSVQYKQMQFKCTKCFVGFNSKIIYEGHMKRHTIKEEQMNQHLICDICQCVILPQYSQIHYANHFIRYQCIECYKMYTNLRTAKSHYKSSHDKSLRECNLCNFTTNSGRALRYHGEKKHSGVINECTICGKVLSNPSALKYHNITVHNTEPIQLKPCPQCNKLLKPRSLKVHIKEVHGGDINAFCIECKKHFKTNKCLQQHYKYHSNHIDINLRITCDHCGKMFKRKQDLVAHIMRMHMPETKKNKCNQCDKTFPRKCYALQHEKNVHSNDTELHERNHMCDYCGKGFTKAIILKAHVRIHTGERPYKCNICDATFTQSGPLYTHKRLVHLKEKRKK